MERRAFVNTGSAAAVGLAVGAGLLPDAARAQDAAGWNKLAFDSRTLADVAKALGGGTPAESRELLLQAPEIAENGAVVRISVQSQLPATSLIALVVDKNPNALAAMFEIPAGTDASVATNVKLGQSSLVYAVARSGDKLYYAVRDVKVTLGGCGA